MTQRSSDVQKALTLQLEHRGSELVLSPRGVVDLATLELLTDALNVLEMHGDASAVVDLTETEFLACCTIRPLAALRAALEATRRRLTLMGAHGVVRHVLSACDLREVLADTTAANGVVTPPRPARELAHGNGEPARAFVSR